jgi:hypothetical protein
MNFKSPGQNTTPTNNFHPDDAFSPGTKFVVELARLMKLEEGHSAPLSLIWDKHWDQLQGYFETREERR